MVDFHISSKIVNKLLFNFIPDFRSVCVFRLSKKEIKNKKLSSVAKVFYLS